MDGALAWNYNEADVNVTAVPGLGGIPMLLIELGTVFVNSFVSDQNWNYRRWENDASKIETFLEQSTVIGEPAYRKGARTSRDVQLTQSIECAHMRGVVAAALRSFVQCVLCSPLVMHSEERLE